MLFSLFGGLCAVLVCYCIDNHDDGIQGHYDEN